MKPSRRTVASFLMTLMLVGVIVVSYGLDWQAALWADYHDQPAKPAPTQQHYEKWVVNR